MTTSTDLATATGVTFRGHHLYVALSDGRTIAVPLAWYPRLAEATTRERRDWQLIGPGLGIHFPRIDEDISVDALLRGGASQESPTSLRRWRRGRKLRRDAG